nr:MAG TPA: hypothetical protein [Bacteriophage sp.]
MGSSHRSKIWELNTGAGEGVCEIPKNRPTKSPKYSQK